MGKDKSNNLESIVEEGFKLISSQKTINGLAVATFAKTFFGLDDKQAGAIGVGYALLAEHLSQKELGDGSTTK